MSEEIIIREDFRSLIPPLKKEELEQLHKSLEAAGKAREPIVVWRQENILLDGHHRYEYCRKNGLEFTVRRVTKQNEQEAKNWMILNQLGRRNLDPKAAAKLRGQLYLGRKKSDSERATEGGKAKAATAASGQSDHKQSNDKTAEQVGKETGVSEKTVRRDAKYAEALDKLDAMAKEGAISEEDRESLVKGSKTKVIEAASELAGEEKEPPKPKSKTTRKAEPYKAVVKSFAKLEIDQQRKALKEIEDVWNSQ